AARAARRHPMTGREAHGMGACLAPDLDGGPALAREEAVLRSAAMLARRAFAWNGARMARKLEAYAPSGVVGLHDERYGDEPDMVLDVYRPAWASGPLPTVVWVHGGGWLSGAKEDLAGYLKLVASKGYAVVGPRYSLAPERRYPTPTRQVMQALGHLGANAERLHLDPCRTVIAGDSAGAQIAAQVGALVTTPGYSDEVGIEPTLAPG